jgi:hypothetical protein
VNILIIGNAFEALVNSSFIAVVVHLLGTRLGKIPLPTPVFPRKFPAQHHTVVGA